MKKIIAVIILSLLGQSGISLAKANNPLKNKGKVFFYWGWNRGYFSDSDIHFKGDDYNFTLYDVKAKDRQSAFSVNTYLNPANVTIPQTNYRFGYFFHENYTVSLGLDHMKYVMVQNQHARIKGRIAGGYAFDKTYDGEESVQLTKDFLMFEHTNGLNYVNIEVSRFDNVSHLLGISTVNFQVNLIEGIGTGVLYPKTNSTLLGKQRTDRFHLSGYGLSAKVAINFTFYKYFFIQPEFKTGYINLPDIITTSSSSDSASQNFTYIQTTIVLGTRLSFFK